MNNQMIEKLNNINNNACPEFTFDNPLLDRNVTNALSKSFIKILDVLKNPNSNNSLRLSVLEIIRKTCCTEPKEHIKIDDSLTEIISEFHCSNVKQKTASDAQEKVEKSLDAFLLRRIENCEVLAKFESRLKPEVIQSLINLKQNDIYDILSNDIIYWNVEDYKQKCILNEMFLKDQITDESELLDDIFIKMTPEIERFFLEIAPGLIENTTDITALFFEDVTLKKIIKTCAISSKGFQICCAILNFIFITSSYNSNIQEFISMFINQIKINCPNNSFYSLYPIHLNHIVLLLDLDDELSYSIRNIFVKETVKYLKMLHDNEESSLIMLLSHFPRWFDIFFHSEHYKLNVT